MADPIIGRMSMSRDAGGGAGMSERMDFFSDPEAVARYAEGPPRNVPGYEALQRMTTLLLAERVPDDARS